jgi:hypothetical protein
MSVSRLEAEPPPTAADKLSSRAGTREREGVYGLAPLWGGATASQDLGWAASPGFRHSNPRDAGPAVSTRNDDAQRRTDVAGLTRKLPDCSACDGERREGAAQATYGLGDSLLVLDEGEADVALAAGTKADAGTHRDVSLSCHLDREIE